MFEPSTRSGLSVENPHNGVNLSNSISVEYRSRWGFKVYARAKMKKISNDLTTFVITEIE